MTASSNTSRAPRRRWVAAIITLVVVGLLGGLSWLGWGLRDRHPHFVLDVRLSPALTSALRVGFGRQRITPDLSRTARPVYLAGFSHNRRATEVHDDLWAIAAVFDDGTHRVGLVALDAIGLFHDDVVSLRSLAEAPNELDYVAVASTHNHSAPDLMGLWGPSPTRTGVDPAYREQVIRSAAQALHDAATALAPATVSAREIALSPEGLVADTRPPTVFDSTVRFLQFTNPDTGTTIGSIVGWADHPETPWAQNTAVTADFPGHLRDALEHGVGTAATGLGPGSTHLYINGAIGGLMTTNPDTVVVDPLTRQAYGEPSHDKARAVGRRLAVAILQDIAQRPLAPLPDTRISVVARSFEIPLDNTQFIAASALRVISRGQTRWRHIRTEVGLIQVGDVSLLCVPGEIYPEIVNGGVTHPPGADFDVAPIEVPPLRSITPGRVVFIVGLANDEIGYIIPQSQWDAEAPWSVPPSGPYGESVSAGPRTGPAIYEAVRTLLSPPARVR